MLWRSSVECAGLRGCDGQFPPPGLLRRVCVCMCVCVTVLYARGQRRSTSFLCSNKIAQSPQSAEQQDGSKLLYSGVWVVCGWARQVLYRFAGTDRTLEMGP